MSQEWKLVPVEPTDDMIVAFAEAWYSKRQCIDDPDMIDAYRGMLAAAPVPPAGEVDSCVPVLKAMAHNYRNGHSWDHLDGKAVIRAADEITRLTAENARLQAEVKQLKSWQETVRENSPLLIQLEALQSELTKARELLSRAERVLYEKGIWGAAQEIESYLAHQSAPAAKGGE